MANLCRGVCTLLSLAGGQGGAHERKHLRRRRAQRARSIWLQVEEEREALIVYLINVCESFRLLVVCVSGELQVHCVGK